MSETIALHGKRGTIRYDMNHDTYNICLGRWGPSRLLWQWGGGDRSNNSGGGGARAGCTNVAVGAHSSLGSRCRGRGGSSSEIRFEDYTRPDPPLVATGEGEIDSSAAGEVGLELVALASSLEPFLPSRRGVEVEEEARVRSVWGSCLCYVNWVHNG
ncbi:hypothetical protein GUJ93_ZPchr0009g1650 [Zizania palustris]|uniref:Uncharacterized protein n=1 Tax=Zizania palustris TaxID=103762 RepID=A0A8J5S3X9_ZIZPA|nr:hypothetical protein GUJ93_ZPchr0009g1650 [Zizania palustris]